MECFQNSFQQKRMKMSKKRAFVTKKCHIVTFWVSKVSQIFVQFWLNNVKNTVFSMKNIDFYTDLDGFDEKYWNL